MVHHEHWVHHIWDMLSAYVWKHRILLYIALVLTVTLAVELFDITFVGK